MKKMWPAVIFLTLCQVGCVEDSPKKLPEAPQKAAPQKIAPGFFDFTVPPPPPPPEPVKEPVPDEIEEPPAPPMVFPDPRPLMREDTVRTLRGLRQGRVNKRVREAIEQGFPAPVSLKDEDYQQWEGAIFEESRSSLPVDRARILTADMRIPALLEDSLNSQIGGRVIALVPKDIWSPQGRFILIPAYSRIICQYKPLEDIGQSRLGLMCSRLIRPDGVSISLQGSGGADQSGRTGLIGDLDQRVWEKYGAAFLVSAVSALSQTASTIAPNQVVGAASSQMAQNLGQVTAQVIEQNMNLAPILTIPAGAHIQIIPTTDIVLRKPGEKKKTAPPQTPQGLTKEEEYP
jgi:type IV secretion system protein VirB10